MISFEFIVGQDLGQEFLELSEGPLDVVHLFLLYWITHYFRFSFSMSNDTFLPLYGVHLLDFLIKIIRNHLGRSENGHVRHNYS